MRLIRNIMYTLLLLLGLVPLAVGQQVEIFNTPGPGSWTVPCGVTSVTVAVYGGGGGGGGSNTNSFAGGGGGAGGYAEAVFAVVPGQIIPYTIGAGGTGGGPAGSGTVGQQSNLQPFSGLVAFGGQGGMPASVGGAGGTGGAGSAWATNVTGGTGVNGNGAIGGQGGSAGGPNGGSGGTGGAPGITGGAGVPLGGGGGGGGKKSGGTNPFGGNGANGGVVFTYNLPYVTPSAGPDQSTCNAIFMNANAPTAPWIGTWSIVSFSGGTPPIITNVNDPNTQVTIPVPGNCATLQWTFTQAGCQTMSDQVTVCYPLLCNDDPCGAISLPVNAGPCSYTTFSNINATASTGMVEPGCGSYQDNDAWYSVTVPANGVVTITGTDLPGGSAMLTNIALYSEGPGGCNDLIHEGCDFSSFATDLADITYTGTPGETIYIRVWEVNEQEGLYQLCATTPTTNMQQIPPGATTITCGSAYFFTDPGGDGGNYANNTTANYILCPDTPGQFVTVDFTSGPLTFSTQAGWDFLTIIDGAADTSYMIGQYSGNEAAGPGIVTSSAPDGCLTFIFESDQVNTAAGWLAAVSCTSTPGVNDSTCTATDCTGECGTWICASGLYPAENIGNNFEEMTGGTAGCFSNAGEISTNWFYFTALTAGSIEFTFQGPGGQDYNFAVYGPSSNGVPPCPQYTQDPPVACSQADVSNYLINGSTGMNAVLGAGQSYEGFEGDGWIDALYVTPGETYAMVVNIFQNGGPQPVIDLTIGGTGTLDCTPVYAPVEVHSLKGINQGDRNLISWVAASQRNNDFFTVERSINGFDWELVDHVDGAGSTIHSMYYSLPDYDPYYPVTYYRLSQTDFDGTYRVIGTVAVNSLKSDEDFITDVFPNPAKDYVTFTFSGHDTKTPLNVAVINSLGEVVSIETYDNLYDGMPMTMRTEALSGGLYQVVFTQGENRAVQRLTIIN